MTARTAVERAAIEAFFASSFAADFSPGPVDDRERSILEAILRSVDAEFGRLTYILGLALDFTLLAQRLSHHDPEAKQLRSEFTEATLLDRYELVTKRGAKQANTLSFKFGKKTLGIRAIEEDVCDLFIKADRTGYPSAYVYNTGMWHHHKELLLNCFKLSESGRFILCNELIDFGLEKFLKNTYFGRQIPRVRLFETISREYPRSGPGENSGMVFQGIAYGYLKADRPHLSLIVDKVRTGSARQRRFGDVDGYFGLDLEVSAEAKDDPITPKNVEKELGQFLRDVSNHRVQGLAFVRSIDPASRGLLKADGILSITNDELVANVATWDWRKQDAAVHGLLHFVSHVEQNPTGVRRLLDFIRARDKKHDSLAHYIEKASE